MNFVCQILLLIFCLGCASAPVQRNIASVGSELSFRDCVLAVTEIHRSFNGAFYYPSSRFALDYHKEEVLLERVKLLDELGIKYRVIRIEFPDSFTISVEVIPEGDSLLAKFLRRTKSQEKGLRVLISDNIDGEDVVAFYNHQFHWVVLEKEFLELMKNGEDDYWLPALSHEFRHAFFRDRRRKEGFLGYRSEIYNDGKVSDALYGDYLLAEESYNYVKQLQSHLGRFLRAKKEENFKAGISMIEALENAVNYGRDNISRFIEIYKKAKNLKPKLIVQNEGKVRFLMAEYKIEGEILVVPLKQVDENFDVKKTSLNKWRSTINNALKENLEIFEGDLSRLNQMADSSELGL